MSLAWAETPSKYRISNTRSTRIVTRLEEDYRIHTVAVFDHSKLVYAKNKCIVLYDCEIKRPVATQASKGVALKVVKVD